MSTLEEVFASAGEAVIIRTLELSCDAWTESVYICDGFEDQACTTEDLRTLTFEAVNIGIQLAKKNNKGNQALAFEVSNADGKVQRLVDLALDAGARVAAVYRTYLSTNKHAPAEQPYRLTIMSGTLQGLSAQLQCGFFDLIGVAWPRDAYTVNFVPGLRYL